MSNSSSNTNVRNERLLLVEILNIMYNDNNRQINSLTDTINNLNNSNNMIRNLLVQFLSENTNLRPQSNRRIIRNNIRNDPYPLNFNRLGATQDNIYTFLGEYNFPLNGGRQNTNNQWDEYARQLLNNFFQPINVYPTQSQIEAATRRVRFGDIIRPINTSCPISMEHFNDNDQVMVIRHCGHTFHADSLTEWFGTNSRCPVCRYDIRDYQANINGWNNNRRDISGNFYDLSGNYF